MKIASDIAVGAPIMMASSGDNGGFQIGGQSTEFAILVLNDQGQRACLRRR